MRGFTLVELGVVLLILGLMLALVLPRLPDLQRASLEGQAGRLAAAIEWIAEEAVTIQRPLRLRVEDGRPRLILEVLGEDGWQPYMTGLEGALRIEPPVRIEGEGAYIFRPEGTGEAFTLVLASREGALAIAFDPVAGVRVKPPASP